MIDEQSVRYSFASQALARGHNRTLIDKLLGHRQPQTIARYAHRARHSVKFTAARIADSLEADITGLPKDSHATRSPAQFCELPEVSSASQHLKR